jgi:hypothetical protein
MLLIATFLAFAVLGWVRAARRGGTLADRVQFALAHAIPATLVALALVILAARMGWTG